MTALFTVTAAINAYWDMRVGSELGAVLVGALVPAVVLTAFGALILSVTADDFVQSDEHDETEENDLFSSDPQRYHPAYRLHPRNIHYEHDE
ncbi:hypothetical protein [Neisseria arctica]|uniref:hypothetical protein n=1 Tax=Neisseria arctica TaxID=1470200 RepID=UPI00128CB6C7|nr:hypothetical protein [Neisseria arctica]UOO85709.1 hypothetical protein LVJ86_05565 [Neisseria arctica]